MENKTAKEKLKEARTLLLEVEVMALQKDMFPFSEDLDNMQRKIYNWEWVLK